MPLRTEMCSVAPGYIMVAIELAGGWDELNTLVPYTNDDYYAARRDLSIPFSSVLRVTENLGFHPSLAEWAVI